MPQDPVFLGEESFPLHPHDCGIHKIIGHIGVRLFLGSHLFHWARPL